MQVITFRLKLVNKERLLSASPVGYYKSIKTRGQEEAFMEYVTLNNGIKMPILGYGVFQVKGEECERCVHNFYPDRLVDLCSFAEVCPAVNQVETHVF